MRARRGNSGGIRAALHVLAGSRRRGGRCLQHPPPPHRGAAAQRRKHRLQRAAERARPGVCAPVAAAYTRTSARPGTRRSVAHLREDERRLGAHHARERRGAGLRRIHRVARGGRAALSHFALREGSALLNLNQVTLPSVDVERSSAFYRRLGFTQIVQAEARYARFECPDGGSTFSLHRVDTMPAGAWMVVYFECPDLDARCESLRSQGVAFDSMPEDRSWLWREARLRDPDGNEICLYWAGENRRFPPWRIGGAAAPLSTTLPGTWELLSREDRTVS